MDRFELGVHNLPSNWRNYEYIIARDVEGELWFWGCYETAASAWRCRAEMVKEGMINAVVIPTKDVTEV